MRQRNKKQRKSEAQRRSAEENREKKILCSFFKKTANANKILTFACYNREKRETAMEV